MERSFFRIISTQCTLCRALQQRSRSVAKTCTAIKTSTQLRPVQHTRNASSKSPRQTLRTKPVAPAQQSQTKVRRLSSQDAGRIQACADRILQHPRIPSEAETIESLREIEIAARHLFDVQEVEQAANIKGEERTPASALLALDPQTANGRQSVPSSTPSPDNVDFLSTLAFKVVEHERVFITPTLLERYVRIQSLLQRPSMLPQIFYLYGNKSVPAEPSQGSSEIRFSAPSPNAVAAAVSPQLAKTALDTAIRAHDLPSALEIISTTYGTTAYQRNKAFRQALPPIVGACLAPVAAYTLAANLSSMQMALPPEVFTTYAFAGIITYVTAVGSIGYVALTTRNDQMERVTWVIGLPLWERWVREDERAACDAVAQAWGFRERGRWGEEEGEKWEMLKEWLGIRGMVLDKVGLMEGME